MFQLSDLAQIPSLSLPQIIPAKTFFRPVIDSREANIDTLFFALPGVLHDGWEYLEQVEQLGCEFAVVPKGKIDDLSSKVNRLTLLPAEDVIQVLSHILATLGGSYPEILVAVTGTNGKSSISFYIAQLASLIGLDSAIVCTFGIGPINQLVEAKQTTPDILSLHTLMHKFSEDGIQCVAFEASSHALDQRRTEGVPFQCAIFSNLTQDHLDYHGTMENYAVAKRKLFDSPSLKRVVINADDAYAKFMAQNAHSPIYYYSVLHGVGDFVASQVTYDEGGICFQLVCPIGKYNVSLPLIGEFNVSNVLAAMAALWDFVEVPELLIKQLQNLKAAPGRMQRIKLSKGPLVIVDYAHTSEALRAALEAVRAHTQGKVITVFGCGGDRDTRKRPKMTQAALNYSDSVWLTTDNPRTEVPISIINEASLGFEQSIQDGVLILELDRRLAIQQAIQSANEKDTVLIAGKGHEAYQEIQGVKHHFDDVAEARSVLELL